MFDPKGSFVRVPKSPKLKPKPKSQEAKSRRGLAAAAAARCSLLAVCWISKVKVPYQINSTAAETRYMTGPTCALLLASRSFREEIGFTGHIGREQAQLNPGISSYLSYRDSHASPRAAGPAGALAPALGRVAPRGTTTFRPMNRVPQLSSDILTSLLI